MTFFWVFIVAFLITRWLTPAAKQLALHTGIVDAPGERKIHKAPIPYLGGIAIYLGFLASLLWQAPLNAPLIGILVGSGFLIVLGVVDDRFAIKASWKLLGQIGVAVFTYFLGVGITYLVLPWGPVLALGKLSLPVTVIWVVGLINTMNLIDGMDGLATGIAAIGTCFLAVLAVEHIQFNVAFLSVALLGATLGFLRYNFAPAQIFMGDTGSMFLGYALACSAMMGVLKTDLPTGFFLPLIILGVPIFDTLFAIVRRLKNKQGIFSPDKGHIHHRLLQAGMTQRQAAIFVYFTCMVLGLLAVFVSFLEPPYAFGLLGISLGLIASILLVPKFRSGTLAWLMRHFL
ncbi:MAG: glycosyltransferase family 4 protein [Candidatus Margulisiibacteriota bacterium]